MSADQTLTSVKVDTEVFKEFKILCVRHKFTWQKLADRSLHLFVTDPEFREKVLKHDNLSLPKV